MTLIANTVTTTKVKDIRLKLNEVISVVNTLQSNGIIANTSQYLQVANAEAKYATNNYVNLILANTNAYIAEVAAAASPASEALDYGYIISPVYPDLSRDYGTL